MKAAGSIWPWAVTLVSICACGSDPPQPKRAGIAFDADGTPNWLPAVEKACARVASCSSAQWAPELRSPGACVEFWPKAVRSTDEALRTCLLSARACVDVETCIRAQKPQKAVDYCASHAGVFSACVDDAFVTCAEKPEETTYVDCKLLGGTCGEGHVSGGLLVRGCSSPKLCPANAPEARCESDREVINCRDGLAERIECPMGSRCEIRNEGGGERVARCTFGEALRCRGLDAAYCNRDALVECLGRGSDGEVRITDCGKVGLRCVEHGKAASCRLGVQNDCEGEAARCDGDLLTFCAGGRKRAVSCRSLGFPRCDPSAHGLEAACSP